MARRGEFRDAGVLRKPGRVQGGHAFEAGRRKGGPPAGLMEAWLGDLGYL